ncbi:MAG: hypothetical protein ACLPYB_10325 [Desulfobaccales bacterium]
MERQTRNFAPRPAPSGPPGRQTALSRYLAPLQPGRGILLWGGQLRPLAAAAAAWGAARGAPVLLVDAANLADPYALVREARTLGLAPREALDRVRISRAFTCHQLVRLLREILPPFLSPGCLVLLLGPVSLFYDEQVPLPERRRLFQELTQLLGRIKSQAALLLLQLLLPKEADNRHFGKLLAPRLDYFVEMGSSLAGRGESRRLPSLTSPCGLQRGDL